VPESTENPLYVCKDDAALRERAEKWEGRPQLWEWEKKSVEKEDVRAGTSVRVQVDYRKPQRRGSVGTIKKRYGTAHYTAFEVLFPDGAVGAILGPSAGRAREAALSTTVVALALRVAVAWLPF